MEIIAEKINDYLDNAYDRMKDDKAELQAELDYERKMEHIREYNEGVMDEEYREWKSHNKDDLIKEFIEKNLSSYNEFCEEYLEEYCSDWMTTKDIDNHFIEEMDDDFEEYCRDCFKWESRDDV